MKLTTRQTALIAVFFIPALCAFASGDDAALTDDQIVHRAYIEKDMDSWQGVVDRRRAKEDPSAEYLEKTINFEYGFVAWALSKLDEEKQRAKTYLAYAREDLERYAAMDDCRRSRAEAYESAFVAYDIKLNPMKAPFTGLKSLKAGKNAVKSDSLDYFAHIQQGNVQYYMPKMFGGSRKKAIESYKTAWSLMQSNFDREGRYNWMYLNLLLTIGDAYKGLKDYDSVRVMYDSVLNLAPDFKWVRDELYPNLPK